MSVRDLIDEVREAFVNSEDAPTRAVVYIRNSDLVETSLNAFVNGIEFNQEEKDDKKVNRISFRGLILEQEPTYLDTVTYNSKVYKVRTWDKIGNTYSVEAENAKRNKVTSRKFK